MRGILIHPEDISPLWPRRLQEAGITHLGLHPVGGGQAHLSLERMLAGREEPEMRAFRSQLERRGIALEHEMHALRYLLPESLLGQRPDFFPMDEAGERGPGPNMCASSADGLAHVAEAARKLALALPSPTHRYFFWLDDTATRGCRCPACRELSPSDQQTAILNAMVGGIRQADREGRLAYLAYVSTLAPPRSIRPDPGLFLEYAPFHRDPHRPMDDPHSPENSRERASLPEILELFDPGQGQVLEYWMDNSLYSRWQRPPRPFTLDEEVMARDVRWYRELGFGSITSFGCFLGPDYEALHGPPPLARYGQLLSQK